LSELPEGSMEVFSLTHLSPWRNLQLFDTVLPGSWLFLLKVNGSPIHPVSYLPYLWRSSG